MIIGAKEEKRTRTVTRIVTFGNIECYYQKLYIYFLSRVEFLHKEEGQCVCSVYKRMD